MILFYPSKKSLILSIIAGVTAFTAFVIFILIIHGKIGAFRNELSKTNNYLKDSELALKIKNEKNDLKDPIALVDSFFLQPGEEAIFIERVESLGKSLGLKVATDSVVDSEDQGGKGTLDLNLKYEGNLENIISFLRNLEELPYATTISGTTMNVVEGGKNIWSGSTKISVYKDKK